MSSQPRVARDDELPLSSDTEACCDDHCFRNDVREEEAANHPGIGLAWCTYGVWPDMVYLLVLLREVMAMWVSL